jgi:hypothetical protein
MTDEWLPQPPRSARQAVFAATCRLLVVIGGAIAVFFAIAGPMSSDSCRPEDDFFRCTGTGQSVAFWLPLGGWLLAILVVWASVILLSRRHKPPWLGLAAGVGVFVVAMTIEWLAVSR